MQITHIVGSPRKNSYSRQIATRFCKTAEKKGAEVNTYNLNTMDYKACQACFSCKTGSKMCVINDELKSVLEEIDQTDTLVVSSPIFCMDVPGPVKTFFDRLSSYLDAHDKDALPKSQLSKGKKAVFVLAQGAGESLFREVYEKYQFYFNLLGFSETHVVRAVGLSGSEQGLDPELLNRAENLALNMV